MQLPEDHSGTHYGLFVDDKLVSVVSLFLKDNQLQFRKFATLVDKQGMGYGSKLLRYVMNEYLSSEIHSIWCNAREEKCLFYERFGLKQTKQKFSKAGINYIIMKKSIN
ncbi:GNAT family N-acetyltransferase [Fulvivirga marina]|uniref:GNAT family N-acetyltransferase n=1 Tax=Fulvivirga marina TaxID=2494733 RepID=UPI00293D2A98|nr:GNAT family N-acetyltransferase [Fulvivirga marina]